MDIGKATAQLHRLVNIWSSKQQVTKELKKLLCLQPPLNTAVWGAESWTLTTVSVWKLQQFHHTTIHKIMSNRVFEIMSNRVFEVEGKRITNRGLCESFDNIRNVMELIKERQLTWLEHVLKMDPKQNTRKLVNVHIQRPRGGGHPQHNLLLRPHQKVLAAIGEIDSNDPNAATVQGMDCERRRPFPRPLARRCEKVTSKVECKEATRTKRERQRAEKPQRIQAEEETQHKSHVDCYSLLFLQL